MEQTTLKYLRVLIPGLIILFGLLPINDQLHSFGINLNNYEYNYIIIIALLLGAIYYQLNIQHLITRPSHYLITKNIFDKLITISSCKLSDKQKEFIWKNRFYINIFYNIIDNDESLKQKANIVRFNGIFWTTSADIFIISFLFTILYFYEILPSPNFMALSKVFVVFMTLGIILHIISVIKHIKLSNKQLKYIEQFLSSEVHKKINEILQRTS